MRTEHPTVYSTQSGRLCPKCGHPLADCICKKQVALPKGDGIVRIQRDSKSRKGKTVTLISGVPLSPDGLRELASELKRLVGSGGAVKDGIIEIQGDHRTALLDEMIKRGFKAKLAGG